MKKNRPIKLIKYVVIGLILLFLFHFESLSLGPIKISHLWKGVLLLFLLFTVLRKSTLFLFIYKPLLLLSVLQLLNIEIVNNTFNAFLIFGTTLILPLLGIYVLQFSSNQLKQGLIFFASFFILAFVPYELGLLESYGDSYELTGYGVEQQGIIGPFQGAHAASTALAGSFLVILYFWFTKAFNRFYLSVLLVFGFYFLVFTYVRTGMLMVLVGVTPMLLYFIGKGGKTRVQIILVSALFAVLISGWVLTNETLMDRITGKRATGIVETDSFESLGSGRGQIYIYAVEIYLEANIVEQLFGIGLTEQKNRMQNKLGNALIPHNGFLQLLTNNGIIGLSLFLIFLKKIYKQQKNADGEGKYFLKGLLFAYVTMTFFQNYDMIYMYLILILSIAYMVKIKHYKNYHAISSSPII